MALASRSPGGKPARTRTVAVSASRPPAMRSRRWSSRWSESSSMIAASRVGVSPSEASRARNSLCQSWGAPEPVEGSRMFDPRIESPACYLS